MARLSSQRRWQLAAVAISLALHVALFVRLLTLPPAPLSLPRAISDSIDLEIEQPTAKPSTPSYPPPPTRAIPHAGHAAHRSAAAVVAPPTPAPIAGAASDIVVPPSPPTYAGDVPRRLDLSLHAPIETASPGGETVRNLPGEGEPPDARRSLAQPRIDAWIADDSATRRVDKGLVDDWFGRLGKSIEVALKKNPPPTPPMSAMASDALSEWQSAAEAYGKSGTPGEPSGPDTSASGIPPADYGGSTAALGSMHTFQMAKAGGGAGLFAVIELSYDFSGKLLASRLLSSSGDKSFNQHVLKVVALGLPAFPDVPDGGFGIHPDGSTRSVWQIQGHLSFQRDAKNLSLKDDGWYLPLAAAGALVGASGVGFDETTGSVSYTDLRHPTLKCDAKLLQVY